MQDMPILSELDPRRETVFHTVFLLAALTVILSAAALEVRNGQIVLPGWGLVLPESCSFKRLTGVECPGCGLTRSVVCLVHGDFLAAWRYNPGGYVFVALVAFQLPYRVAQIYRIRRGFSPWCPARFLPAAVYTIALILMAQWLVRCLGSYA